MNTLLHKRDQLWFVIWIGGLSTLWVWDSFFLNRPAFERLQEASLNTFAIALEVIVLTALTGWISGVVLARTENSRWHFVYLIATFFFNLIRSVPQIVGILIGYAIVTALIQQGILKSNLAIFLSLGATIALFIFLELTDLIRERIAFFKKRDFYNAMLTCGISEGRIINREILFKNSLSHIFNKLISVFGITIFLQCSIDFIVSVGLSTAISAVNFPVTLGNQLAKIDSKQDILAIGHTLTSPSYFPQLFLQHLQGISVAFVIVFSLLCIYKIANGFAERMEL